MGKETFAHYQTEDCMAQTPEHVNNLLSNVWARAKEAANREREMLEAYISEEGETLDGGIQPWDWRYYAEKVRQAKFNFDESELKSYLSLDSITNAMFDVSNKLFGLKYLKRDDVIVYHPDVNVYEVRRNKAGSEDDDDDDELVAIFLHDNDTLTNRST